MRVLIIAAVLVASACGRAHVNQGFGNANHEAFQAQRVRAPDEPAPKPNMALDAQETSVISGSYVRGLAGKTGRSEPQPVLYVNPTQNGGTPQRLAPSVPRE
jgi:hypothetical protein